MRGANAALSCSKGSRGLFVPSRVIGIFTDTTISPGPRSRQRPDHYTIRAGRNLPDKEFRYLRTVIVTAAVPSGTGQVSGCIQLLSNSHSPVFLVNSCLDRFTAPGSRQDPLSRSYGASLPSSLTVDLPCALVCSTRPRVSVCGTGRHAVWDDSGFSRRRLGRAVGCPPEGAPYSRVPARAPDFPGALIALRPSTCCSVSRRRLRRRVSASPACRVPEY